MTFQLRGSLAWLFHLELGMTAEHCKAGVDGCARSSCSPSGDGERGCLGAEALSPSRDHTAVFIHSFNAQGFSQAEAPWAAMLRNPPGLWNQLMTDDDPSYPSGPESLNSHVLRGSVE